MLLPKKEYTTSLAHLDLKIERCADGQTPNDAHTECVDE